MLKSERKIPLKKKKRKSLRDVLNDETQKTVFCMFHFISFFSQQNQVQGSLSNKFFLKPKKEYDITPESFGASNVRLEQERGSSDFRTKKKK